MIAIFFSRPLTLTISCFTFLTFSDWSARRETGVETSFRGTECGCIGRGAPAWAQLGSRSDHKRPGRDNNFFLSTENLTSRLAGRRYCYRERMLNENQHSELVL